ncbi:MAG TPA: hypothetical protein VMV95_02715 [Bacillota bacterium]|nr:hypothetical protein [Bacillota bacterium]
MKLKTLKDLNREDNEEIKDNGCYGPGYIEDFVETDELKAEAVKWVKEDFETIENIRNGLVVSADYFTKKWMRRLDITEEDLK